MRTKKIKEISFLTIKLPIFIEDEKLVYFSIIYSILICIFFSSDFLSKILNLILKYLIKGRIFIYCLMVICLSSITLSNSIVKQESYNKENINLDNCIKISYIGDMLLFEKDIEKAKKDDSFDFSNYFKYTKDYFGDYVIANLEGPIINKDYSIGIFNIDVIVTPNNPEINPIINPEPVLELIKVKGANTEGI